MTRSAVGGLAAGTFVAGLLVGFVIPGAVARADHDRLMNDHMAAMGSMMGGPMGSMMGDGGMSMMGGPMGSMMGDGGMSMMPAGSATPDGHWSHHMAPGR